eukprot:341119-Ditylum_brightwellii.AAC.1
MDGHYKYALQDGADLLDEWLLEHVIPNIVTMLISVLSLVLALPILWAFYDDNTSTLISLHISQCIKEAYNCVHQCRRVAEIPVKKSLQVATGHAGGVHFDAVPLRLGIR